MQAPGGAQRFRDRNNAKRQIREMSARRGGVRSPVVGLGIYRLLRGTIRRRCGRQRLSEQGATAFLIIGGGKATYLALDFQFGELLFRRRVRRILHGWLSGESAKRLFVFDECGGKRAGGQCVPGRMRAEISAGCGDGATRSECRRVRRRQRLRGCRWGPRHGIRSRWCRPK